MKCRIFDIYPRAICTIVGRTRGECWMLFCIPRALLCRQQNPRRGGLFGCQIGPLGSGPMGRWLPISLIPIGAGCPERGPLLGLRQLGCLILDCFWTLCWLTCTLMFSGLQILLLLHSKGNLLNPRVPTNDDRIPNLI